MITPADPLPDDIETAHQLIRELLETLGQQIHLNAKLQHQLEQLLRQRYGRKSERVDPAQLLLFAQEILAQAGPSPSPLQNPRRSPSPRSLRVRPSPRRRATAESRSPRACPASRSCTTSPPNNSRVPIAAPCAAASARKSASSSNTSLRR